MRTSIFGTNPLELGVNDGNRQEVLARIQADARYVKHFKAVFIDPTSWENIIKAIAAFERTLISADSRYVQSVAGKVALTEQEMRGQKLFFSDQAKCLQCHGSPNFNDQFSTAASVQSEPRFHNTGLWVYRCLSRAQARHLRDHAAGAGHGQISCSQPAQHRTQGPVHAGRQHGHARGGTGLLCRRRARCGQRAVCRRWPAQPHKDARISQIMLSEADKSDLLAFLKTLTDIGFVTNASIAAPSP